MLSDVVSYNYNGLPYNAKMKIKYKISHNKGGEL